jgi:hypothetical protein
MTWNSTAPLGSVSVKANNAILQANTTYIETNMGKSIVGTNTVTTRDHFWAVDPNLDGRHRFIQSPAFTVGGLPTDPVLGAGMSSVLYSKLKVVAESAAQQDVQPFFRNASQIMQVLGIRACAVFDVDGVIAYAHNITSVVKTATGLYTVTFANAFPSNAYLVMGSAIRSDASADRDLSVNVQSAVALATSKATTFVKVMTKTFSGDLANPIQAWLVCFGG